MHDYYIGMDEREGQITNGVVGSLNHNNEMAHLIKTC